MLMSDIAILASENAGCSDMWFNGLKSYYMIDSKPTEFDIISISNAKIIFIKRDFVEFFMKTFENYLREELIIISHCSDIPVSDTKILDLPKVKRWYAMNTMIKHPKLTTIPIGLTTHEKKHGDMRLFQEVVDMNIPKSSLLYINFNVKTNPKARGPVMQLMQSKGFDVIEGEKPLDQKEYWMQLSSHKFCVSPPGNGVDCHRIWECLYLGTIPIVMKHPALDQFSGMKILFIDDWNVINEQFLEEKYQEFETNYDNQQCYVEYWNQEIKKCI